MIDSNGNGRVTQKVALEITSIVRGKRATYTTLPKNNSKNVSRRGAYFAFAPVAEGLTHIEPGGISIANGVVRLAM